MPSSWPVGKGISPEPSSHHPQEPSLTQLPHAPSITSSPKLACLLLLPGRLHSLLFFFIIEKMTSKHDNFTQSCKSGILPPLPHDYSP